MAANVLAKLAIAVAQKKARRVGVVRTVVVVMSAPFFLLLAITLIAGASLADNATSVTCPTAVAAADTAPASGPVTTVPAGPLSPSGTGPVPANLLPIYQAAQQAYGVPWNVLAAINKIESNFGQNMNTSSAGAVGWMQFMPATWDSYGVDANHDGLKDPYNPYDAIFGAANYLQANHAATDLYGAIFHYNHADWYVREVLSLARSYAANPQTGEPVSLPAAFCETNTGVEGKVIIAPGANLPGQPVQPVTLAFLAQVAGLYGKPLICTTGTNHSKFTVDGNVSDHYFGHACDFGMNVNGGSDDSPVGDAIAAACLEAAGDSPAQAIPEASAGGLFNREHGGLRIQCIWKTYLGGNHHNHVHIGARPA